jgi:hypothetical protein
VVSGSGSRVRTSSAAGNERDAAIMGERLARARDLGPGQEEAGDRNQAARRAGVRADDMAPE